MGTLTPLRKPVAQPYEQIVYNKFAKVSIIKAPATRCVKLRRTKYTYQVRTQFIFHGKFAETRTRFNSLNAALEHASCIFSARNTHMEKYNYKLPETEVMS